MADIELGSPFSNSARRNIDKLMPRWSQLGRLLRLALFKWQSFSRKKDDIRVNRRFQIEDYRKGYPRFTALMSAHGAFHIFRRFTSVRVRLLLLAQDKISCLEDQLLKIDEEEKAPLFLASCREDKNPEREAIISELHSNLATYDKLMESSQQAFPYESPHAQYVLSLQRWLRGNPCIARSEASFLETGDDLLALSSTEEGVVSWLERTICEFLMRLQKNHRPKSRDPRVHIFPRSSTTTAARAILSPLIAFLLLAPVVICNSVESLTARLVIIIVSTAIFICSVSLLTKARAVDMAVAGATYTTVLVVFIAGPNTTIQS